MNVCGLCPNFIRICDKYYKATWEKMLHQFKFFNKKCFESSLKIHNCLVFDNKGSSCFQSFPGELFPILLNCLDCTLIFNPVCFHEVYVESVSM